MLHDADTSSTSSPSSSSAPSSSSDPAPDTQQQSEVFCVYIHLS